MLMRVSQKWAEQQIVFITTATTPPSSTSFHRPVGFAYPNKSVRPSWPMR